MEEEQAIQFNSRVSLDRPAWLQNDLHAYKNKYVQERRSGKSYCPRKLIDYFIISQGMQ